MAFFNRVVIKDFTKARYLALVQQYPKLGEEKTQMYIMLSLTFAALSFLGLFAINPTLTTIVELNRKLDDSQFVAQALKTKVANLSSLHTQYEVLTNTWPIVDAAVPNDPQVIALLGQIQSVAKDAEVKVSDLESFQVELAKLTVRNTTIPREASYVITVTALGTKDKLTNFVEKISSFNRILSVEEINYAHEEKQSVTIRARAYFAP